jgi:hypothetical protein
MFLHFLFVGISKNIKHVIFQISLVFVLFIYIVVMHSKSYVFVHYFHVSRKV